MSRNIAAEVIAQRAAADKAVDAGFAARRLKGVQDMSIAQKRGRKPGSVVINRAELAQAALAELNREAKEELVLLNIKPNDRVTENGLMYDTKVRFNLSADEIKDQYPDHALDEVYVVRTVLYPFQTSSREYEVLLANEKNEAMGYVKANVLIAAQ